MFTSSLVIIRVLFLTAINQIKFQRQIDCLCFPCKDKKTCSQWKCWGQWKIWWCVKNLTHQVHSRLWGTEKSFNWAQEIKMLRVVAGMPLNNEILDHPNLKLTNPNIWAAGHALRCRDLGHPQYKLILDLTSYTDGSQCTAGVEPKIAGMSVTNSAVLCLFTLVLCRNCLFGYFA